MKEKQTSRMNENDISLKNQKRNNISAKQLSDNDRYNYVSGKFLLCIKPITNIIKGKGCSVGESYWFEYIKDNKYRKLSDNNHYDEVIITDKELVNNFVLQE